VFVYRFLQRLFALIDGLRGAKGDCCKANRLDLIWYLLASVHETCSEG
jgi:hypothetical protein